MLEARRTWFETIKVDIICLSAMALAMATHYNNANAKQPQPQHGANPSIAHLMDRPSTCLLAIRQLPASCRTCTEHHAKLGVEPYVHRSGQESLAYVCRCAMVRFESSLCMRATHAIRSDVPPKWWSWTDLPYMKPCRTSADIQTSQSAFASTASKWM